MTAPDALAEAGVAAAHLVAAFGAHDTERYFESFAPDATFLFHNVPERLASRGQYRALWSSWEDDGFRVLGCRSLDQQLTGIDADVVVFTHRVRTRVAGEAEELRERESIVLRRGADGRWLGVHEHLSVDPGEYDE